MATGFAFEIADIAILTAEVVLRNGGEEYRAGFESQQRSDGLGQFLRAVTDVVTDRLWGATCYWASEVGWLVDVRYGSAWCEVTVICEPEEWPPATQAQTAVFQARIDDELDLARVIAAAYRAVLERYGAARYEELWGHPFPQPDFDALTAWIAHAEELDALIALQLAVREQIVRHHRRTPAEIAEALGESIERIADLLREFPGLSW